MSLKVPIVTLAHHHGLPLPIYQTDHAAGMDLHAAIGEPLTLGSLDRMLVPTGICIAVPTGHEAQVRPRSGLAIKLGLSLVNTPGTIDADYRGEIKVPLINLSRELIVIERGMRIAQLVLSPVVQLTWQPVDQLEPSTRGSGGFGHTGS
ncbi:MAG: dUTP diphosphatase [Acidobacteria bacterium]|nr:dUTP diphosphatase [Acidobacteriota bacterium]